MAEQYVHKNRLQEYAQRAALPLPAYQTFNEGSQHLPQFRSTVVVDGATFISPCTFAKRRAAEQYVAKFAFEGICSKIRQEGIPLIHNDTTFCKSILHEFAARMKIKLPTYTTSELAGLLPSFVTSVVFDGKTYTGGAGRNKKEAEQIGARTVIEWILGQSGTRTVMSEIIKSKGRLFNAIQKGSSSTLTEDNNMPLKVLIENHSGRTVAKEKDVQVAPTNGKLAAEHSIPPRAENPKAGNICEVCSGNIGRSRTVPTLPQHNPLEGSTSGTVNSVSNDSCLAQIIQVKSEVPSDCPPTLPSDSQSINPTSGGKRSRKKNKGGSNSKKTRINE